MQACIGWFDQGCKLHQTPFDLAQFLLQDTLTNANYSENVKVTFSNMGASHMVSVSAITTISLGLMGLLFNQGTLPNV